jgi:Ni,Fe-hydrogenase I large subunit
VFLSKPSFFTSVKINPTSSPHRLLRIIFWERALALGGSMGSTQKIMHQTVASHRVLIFWFTIIDNVHFLHITIVKKEKHCDSPTLRPNTVIQIHGQNISIKDEITSSIYYSKNTIAVYKCKNSKPNANYGQNWKCDNSDSSSKYSWIKSYPNETDLVCKGIFTQA